MLKWFKNRHSTASSAPKLRKKTRSTMRFSTQSKTDKRVGMCSGIFFSTDNSSTDTVNKKKKEQSFHAGPQLLFSPFDVVSKEVLSIVSKF